MGNTHIGEWIWRFLSLALLVAVGWMSWVLYQINRPDLVLTAAFDAAAKARANPEGKSGTVTSAGVISPPPAAEAPVPVAAAPAASTESAPAAVPQASVPEPSKPAAVAEKPAPAPPVPAKSAEEEVSEAVLAWAKAWSSRDVDAYLASYAKDFKVPGGEARSAWENGRRQRIAAPKSIEVGVDGLKVVVTPEGEAKATFRQSYRSDLLEPRFTSKTLAMVRVEGRWLIRQEVSGN